MIIKKRPIITWLLHPNSERLPDGITLAKGSNLTTHQVLLQNFYELINISIQKSDWGLPELIMPSFEEVMRKSASSFEKVMPQLFHEFSEKGECGILLRGKETFIYSFKENQLHIWDFYENKEESIFRLSIINDFNSNQQPRVYIADSLISDNVLFKGSLEERMCSLRSIANFISVYVTVKRYVKVETVIIPQGKLTSIKGTPLEYVEKKKIINQSGQEVLVMDSKWFRKIVNDNDIYVRGFWRMQNKKNMDGEWYKELIFVDSFVRHGYHRNAKIEDDITEA